MAANLARAGFAVTAWNRTPGRAPELDDLGVTRADNPAAAAAASDVVIICVLRHTRCRGGSPRSRWRRGRRPARHARHRLLDDRPGRDPGVRGASHGEGRRDGRRPRSRVGAEGAQKARLTIFVGGEAAGRRPGAAHPRRTRQDDHPRRPDRVRPGGESREQVILAGTYLGVAEGIVLAMKAGLDVEQVVGALRRPARPRAGSSRTAAGGCSRTTTRSASRSRSTARTWDRPQPRRGDRREPAVRGAAAEIEDGLVARATATDDMSALARSIRGRSGLPD
jgi:hypothetical protein